MGQSQGDSCLLQKEGVLTKHSGAQLEVTSLWHLCQSQSPPAPHSPTAFTHAHTLGTTHTTHTGQYTHHTHRAIHAPHRQTGATSFQNPHSTAIPLIWLGAVYLDTQRLSDSNITTVISMSFALISCWEKQKLHLLKTPS